MAVLVNNYQTQLTDELLSSLHPEVRDQLLESIANIKFIQRLIDPDRRKAKDLPRDKDGKIIVDILNPHILEDMDYFRPTAKYFEEHGVLTHLRPNPNPKSDFGIWMKTEIERIWFGMIRPSDGEWIPGPFYWYLNYMPIVKDDVDEGGLIADRTEGFPDVWDGLYLWFHYLHQARQMGLNGIQLAARGRSKSYGAASMLSRLFIVGDGPKSSVNTKGLIMAFDKQKLIVDGTLNKFLTAIDFQAKHTQFPASRLKSTLDGMQWKMGYKDKITGIERGTLNETMGIAINDDVRKGAGKRSSIIFYEEIGQFPGFLEVWNTMRRSVKNGKIAFGQMIGVGTAGEAKSSFYGILEMLYNPEGYDIYALNNFFDKGANGDGRCVFFYGGYLNRAGCMNKDGVSDVTKALIEIFEDRHKVKYSSSDPMTLTRVIAEDPITIQEAIMRKDGSIFPSAALADRLNELKSNPRLLDDIYVGMLKQNSKGEIEFDPTANVKAITHYPHRDNKVEGAIQIFKMPEKDNSGKVFQNRYILSADPYDNDVSETMSLGAIYVLDLWTDRIVAEYVGRPQFADELYDICLRLCLFYNGPLLYENNYKGLFGYFSRKNCLYLLSDIPQFLKDRDLVKGESYGNVAKGCRATTPILNYGMKELRDWLLKETFLTEIDSEGNEVTTSIPNLMHIKSPALLEELIQWNPENNFDRVSSLIMMMLIRQDRLKYIEGKTQDDLRGKLRRGYLGNDPFFLKHSPNKKGI